MIYYVIAFAAGLGITLQTTLNGQLAKGLGGDPVTAADRTCHHAFRRSALCTLFAVTALSSVAIARQDLYLSGE